MRWKLQYLNTEIKITIVREPFGKTAAVLFDDELDARDLLIHRLQLLYCINTKLILILKIITSLQLVLQ
jgi:hypothetical protein